MSLRALGATLALVAAAACFTERERIDVPTVEVVPEGSDVALGDSIRGVVRASDASGLLLVRVLAIGPLEPASARRDTVRLRFDLSEPRDIEFSFALPLRPAMTAGSRIEVQALVVDNQEFEITARDTIVVRAR